MQISGRIVRRVTKRTYDKYATEDYKVTSSNLNPVKPTELEGQIQHITEAIRGKIVDSYTRSKIEVPKEIFKPGASPIAMLSAIDDLLRKTKKNSFTNLITDPRINTAEIVPALFTQATKDFDNPLKLDCTGIEYSLSPNAKNSSNKKDVDKDELEYSITYVFPDLVDQKDQEAYRSAAPKTYTNSSCPISLDSPDFSHSKPFEADKALSFQGWYFTSNYTTRVQNDILAFQGRDITVYAKVIVVSKSQENEEDQINTKKYKIEYHNYFEGEDTSTWVVEYIETDCPLTLPKPSKLSTGGKNYLFKGWYLDPTYNIRVKDQKLRFKNIDTIHLYAFYEDAEDAKDELENFNPPASDISFDNEESDCGEIELSWLKIILIIIIIIKILIQVFVIVFNILKVTADISKDAGLCWISPPNLMSLIAYVMQRLGSLIFMIIGMILLKLWSLLNLDCISSNTLEVIDQINAALSNLTDMLGSVDGLAMDFQGSGSSIKDSLQASLENLKKQIIDQSQKVQYTFKNMKNDLKEDAKGLGKDIADTYSNPATYLAMVPPEIKNKVLGMLDNLEATKKRATDLKKVASSIGKPKRSNQSVARGTEIIML